MNNRFAMFFYSGSLLISLLYGSSYMLPLYMKLINGSEMNIGTFLFFMGVGALFATLTLNKLLLPYLTVLNIMMLGTLAYGSGLLILSHITQVDYTYPLGFVMGVGWGLIYVSSLFVLTSNTSPTQRKNHFSYYAATNAFGAGMAPVIFHILINHGVNLNKVYLIEGSLLTVVTIFFFILAQRHSNKNEFALPQGAPKATTITHSLQFFISLSAIAMAFLYACIFTTLTFFQITFAEINHVNYATFFSWMTISVIFSRVTLIKWTSAPTALLYLSFALALSLYLLLIVNKQPLFYQLSAALFGLSYGLIFPITQTIAVANIETNQRNNVIRYFSLAYFIGIFGFPMVSASIIFYLSYKMIVSLLVAIAIICSMLAIALKILQKQYYALVDAYP